MKKFSNSIKFTDILSNGPSLLIKDQIRLRSIFGGILSILCFGSILYFIWYLGKDIIYRQKPNTIIKDAQFLDYPVKLFNGSTEFFSFRIEDENGNSLANQERMITYDVSYSQYVINTDPNINSTWIFTDTRQMLSNCEKYNGISPKFGDSDYLNLKCFKNYSQNIGGDWSGTYIYLFKIYINFCLNNTPSYDETIDEIIVNCLSRDEIVGNLTGTYFSMYYWDSIIDPQNFSNPITKFVKNTYYLIDANIYKDIELRFKNIQILTDQGFLLTDIVEIDDLMFESVTMDVSTKGNYADSLAGLWIYLTNNVRNVSRSYIKVQEIFANVGGVIKGILLIGWIIVYPINLKHIDITLMSELFDFKPSNSPHIRKSLGDLQKIITNTEEVNIVKAPIIQIQNNNFFSSDRVNNQMLSQDNRSLKNLIIRDKSPNKAASKFTSNKHLVKLKLVENITSLTYIVEQSLKNQNRLKYSVCQLINSVFCCQSCRSFKTSNLDKQFKECEKEIRNYISFNKLIKAVQDMNNLKLLIFNKNQYLAFKFFARPEIKEKDSQLFKKSSEYHDYYRESLENNLKALVEYYSEVTIKDKDDINYKILELIDDNIREYITKLFK